MIKFRQEKSLLLLLFLFSFTAFFLTSDGHRYTIDEDVTQQHNHLMKECLLLGLFCF